MGLAARKLVFMGFANNNQTDQCLSYSFLESVTSKLAIGKMSISYLVPVAEETSLSLPLLETPKTGFVMTRPI